MTNGWNEDLLIPPAQFISNQLAHARSQEEAITVEVILLDSRAHYIVHLVRQ